MKMGNWKPNQTNKLHPNCISFCVHMCVWIWIFPSFVWRRNISNASKHGNKFLNLVHEERKTDCLLNIWIWKTKKAINSIKFYWTLTGKLNFQNPFQMLRFSIFSLLELNNSFITCICNEVFAMFQSLKV